MIFPRSKKKEGVEMLEAVAIVVINMIIKQKNLNKQDVFSSVIHMCSWFGHQET